MNLFEIDKAIENCVQLTSGEFVDTETGEIVDVEALNALEMERETKLRNIGCWVLNLEAEEKALADQIKRFTDRKKSVRNKIDSLKSYVGSYLDGKSWKCDECQFKFTTSESVKYEGNLVDVPTEYLRYREPELDKVKLKKALKQGIEVAGATLEVKKSVSVK